MSLSLRATHGWQPLRFRLSTIHRWFTFGVFMWTWISVVLLQTTINFGGAYGQMPNDEYLLLTTELFEEDANGLSEFSGKGFREKVDEHLRSQTRDALESLRTGRRHRTKKIGREFDAVREGGPETVVYSANNEIYLSNEEEKLELVSSGTFGFSIKFSLEDGRKMKVILPPVRVVAITPSPEKKEGEMSSPSDGQEHVAYDCRQEHAHSLTISISRDPEGILLSERCDFGHHNQRNVAVGQLHTTLYIPNNFPASPLKARGEFFQRKGFFKKQRQALDPSNMTIFQFYLAGNVDFARPADDRNAKLPKVTKYCPLQQGSAGVEGEHWVAGEEYGSRGPIQDFDRLSQSVLSTQCLDGLPYLNEGKALWKQGSLSGAVMQMEGGQFLVAFQTGSKNPSFSVVGDIADGAGWRTSCPHPTLSSKEAWSVPCSTTVYYSLHISRAYTINDELRFVSALWRSAKHQSGVRPNERGDEFLGNAAKAGLAAQPKVTLLFDSERSLARETALAQILQVPFHEAAETLRLPAFIFARLLLSGAEESEAEHMQLWRTALLQNVSTRMSRQNSWLCLNIPLNDKTLFRGGLLLRCHLAMIEALGWLEGSLLPNSAAGAGGGSGRGKDGSKDPHTLLAADDRRLLRAIRNEGFQIIVMAARMITAGTNLPIRSCNLLARAMATSFLGETECRYPSDPEWTLFDMLNKLCVDWPETFSTSRGLAIRLGRRLGLANGVSCGQYAGAQSCAGMSPNLCCSGLRSIGDGFLQGTPIHKGGGVQEAALAASAAPWEEFRRTVAPQLLPYAQYMVQHMQQTIYLDGRSFVAFTETANAIDGDRWMWTDDNAKTLELLLLPGVYEKVAPVANKALGFCLNMMRSEFIFRRTAADPADANFGRFRVDRNDPDVTTEDGVRKEGTGLRFHNGLMNFQVNSSGIYQSYRFHDGRDVDAVLFALPQLQLEIDIPFAPKDHPRPVVPVDLSRQNLSLSLQADPNSDGQIVFISYAGPVRIPNIPGLRDNDRRGGGPLLLHEVGFVDYRVTVYSNKTATLRSVKFTPSQGLKLSRIGVAFSVGLTTSILIRYRKICKSNLLHFVCLKAHETFLYQNPTGKDYGSDRLQRQPPSWWAALQIGNAGFSYSVYTIVRNHTLLDTLRSTMEPGADFLKSLQSTYWCTPSGSPSAADPCLVEETNLITAGGLYDDMARYEVILDNIARGEDQGMIDYSISYDIGAEVNALAGFYLFVTAGAYAVPIDTTEVNITEVRETIDRHLGVYFSIFGAYDHTGSLANVFTRGLSFVTVAASVMYAATGEAKYLSHVERTVDMLGASTFEAASLWVCMGNERTWTAIDCQSGVIFALSRLANTFPLGESLHHALHPSRLLATLEVRFPMALRRATRRARSFEQEQIQSVEQIPPFDLIEENHDDFLWTFKCGITLRALAAYNQSLERLTTSENGKGEFHRLSDENAELLAELRSKCRRYLLLSTKTHPAAPGTSDEPLLEIKTAMWSGETNTETQPWTVLGLFGDEVEKLFAQVMELQFLKTTHQRKQQLISDEVPSKRKGGNPKHHILECANPLPAVVGLNDMQLASLDGGGERPQDPTTPNGTEIMLKLSTFSGLSTLELQAVRRKWFKPLMEHIIGGDGMGLGDGKDGGAVCPSGEVCRRHKSKHRTRARFTANQVSFPVEEDPQSEKGFTVGMGAGNPLLSGSGVSLLRMLDWMMFMFLLFPFLLLALWKSWRSNRTHVLVRRRGTATGTGTLIRPGPNERRI